MEQKTGKSEQLSTSQLKAIQALLTAPTVDEAARKAGVGRTTMYRWLKQDLFKKELKRAKRRMVDGHLFKLQRSVGVAVDTLTAICRDAEAPASARVASAKEILSTTLKVLELEDLSERVAALEAIAEKGVKK